MPGSRKVLGKVIWPDRAESGVMTEFANIVDARTAFDAGDTYRTVELLDAVLRQARFTNDLLAVR